MKGNKGEWSELYVFIKLLGDGKLYAADSDLQKIQGIFYPIIKILRDECSENKKEYIIKGNISIVDGTNGKQLLQIPKKEFLLKSRELLERLKRASGRSFDIPEMDEFLKKIKCKNLKPTKTEKADIKIMVHDLRTGQKPTLGFSIKSMLGKKSTLFNPGKGTNFIYKITGKNRLDLSLVNSIEEESKITNRLKYLNDAGFKLEFYKIQSENLKLNLQLIDSKLPEIIAHILLYRYTENTDANLDSLLKIIKNKNPLEFKKESDHPFYEYKIKNFLTDVALGMTPEQVWKGIYDATGGIIIVKEDGDIVCYHIYNRNEFQEYLLKNTKIEQASTTRYEFGEVYEESGGYFIKLNLQIRFK